jgi:acylphosphatase
MQLRRVHLLASGRVQGVFFRASLRDEARRLGCTGWVRNLSDGRVEAEAQGPPDPVAQLVAFCREGPGQARVDELAVQEREPLPTETGFSVR